MQVERLDHFVLTVRDVETTIAFCEKVLGMSPVAFGAGGRALAFGQSKINLHAADALIRPHAKYPTPRRVTDTAHWLECQDWAYPVLAEPFELKDGHLVVPDRAGRGISRDERALARFAQ